MSKYRTRAGRCISLAFVAAAAVTATMVTPAQASSPQAPSADLGMLVFHGDDIRGYNLTCDPDGGTHPDAQTACRQLHKADGDLTTLRPGSHPSCKEPDSDPVDIEVMGMWKDLYVVNNVHYPNRTCAKASAGLVVPIH